MKKTIISVILFFIFITSLCVIYFALGVDLYISETLFFEMVTAVTAIFGVVSILVQSQENHDLRESQFIVNLNKDYINNVEYQKLLDFLEKVEEGEEFSEDKFDLVSNYFDFFEPIYLLIRKKVIDIETIDDLFAYRFFSVVNNKEVQRQVISPYISFYKNIVTLHYMWKRYRTKHHKDIPFSKTDLQFIDGYGDVCGYFVVENELKSTNNLITVREATLEDFDAIDNLYQALLPGIKTDIISYKSSLAKISSEPFNKILVATLNEKVIGTVQCTICDSAAFNGRPHMVIEYFIVNAKFRRVGVGTALLNEIMSFAKQNNVKSIVLVSSNERKAAHKFYKKLKFSNTVKGFRLDLL